MSAEANPPDQFLPCAGAPAVPWPHWKKQFNVYALRKGLHLEQNRRFPPAPAAGAGVEALAAHAALLVSPAYSDESKNLDFWSRLGAEGQRQFEGLENSEDFQRPHATVLAACEALFKPQVNKLIALRNFVTRKQGASETASEFAAELRILAADCQFGDRENDQIKNFLALNCRDPETQQKIFADHVDDNLADLLRFMVSQESAKKDVRTLRPNVAAISSGNSNSGGRGGKGGRGRQQGRQQNSHQRGSESHQRCDGCGRSGHSFRSDECRAKGETCNSCQGKDHFARQCRSKNGPPKKQIPMISSRMVAAIDNHQFRCVVAVHPLSDIHKRKKELCFIVDSASDVTTITESLRLANFPDVNLDTSDSGLSNYDSSPVNTQGSFWLQAYFKGRSAQLRCFVMPDICFPVLGKDGIRLLSLVIKGEEGTVAALQDNKVVTGMARLPPVGRVAHQLPQSPLDVNDSSTPVIQPEAPSSVSAANSSTGLLNKLVTNYPKLFSEEIGKVPNYQHVIQLREDARPIQCKLRHPPVHFKEGAKDSINSLLKMGIVEKIDKSEWVHAAHFVRKGDGTMRTTVDFKRGINRFVLSTRHPLPLPGEIFGQLSGARVFSKIDITKAYHHVELAPKSRHLTAFMDAEHGLCQFRRLPMGLKDAGAVFQKVIEECVGGIPGVFPYMDDVLIAAKNQEEHDRILPIVLGRLDAFDFRLNLAKLELSVTTTGFLGHVIAATDEGTVISPDPKNSKAISSATTPTDVTAVQRFLGMVNYYKDFIHHMSDLAEPLRNLTRKGVEFEWTNACQTSFDALKSQIASPQVLAVFNPNCETILTTDASKVGLGAVLSQLQDGKERPIAFAAHTLIQRERNYSTPERECLACVWGCEYFEKLLLGAPFLLRTDQNSLLTLLQRFGENHTSKRISRWYDRLSHFDYSVEHIKGEDNICADMLSRLTIPTEELALPDDDEREIIAAISTKSSVTADELIVETRADPILQRVIGCVLNSWPPKRKQVAEDLRSYFDIRNELFLSDSVLFREDRLVVPSALQSRILQLTHSGHPGIVRMKQKLREAYFWPGSNSDAEKFVKSCIACAASGKTARSETVPVTAVPPPSAPWKNLAIDITGPFHTAPQHQRFIVAVTDYFSKYPEILLTGEVTSSRIIDWLEEVFSRLGNPQEIQSDNGPQFISKEFEDFLAAKNIAHKKSAVYNPFQNGLVEVLNRTFKFGAQVIFAEGKQWRSGLLELLASFRATAPENGLSPSELLFGWKIRTDSDIRNPTLFAWGEKKLSDAQAIFALSVSPNLSLAERNDIVQRKFQKRRYGVLKDIRKKPRDPYAVGDFVRYKKPPSTYFKGESPLSQPLRIIKVVGDFCYMLADGQTWNARRLSRYRPPPSDEMFPEFSDHPSRPTINPVPPVNRPPAVIRVSSRASKGVAPTRFDPCTNNPAGAYRRHQP